MDELDQIEFTAISPGLGLKEPELVPRDIPKMVKPPLPKEHSVSAIHQPARPKRPSHIAQIVKFFMSLLLDHCSIALFYGLLCGVSALTLRISGYEAWLQFFFDDIALLIHLMVLVVIYGFYFLFFKQFKIPTLGRLMIFGFKNS